MSNLSTARAAVRSWMKLNCIVLTQYVLLSKPAGTASDMALEACWSTGRRPGAPGRPAAELRADDENDENVEYEIQ